VKLARIRNRKDVFCHMWKIDSMINICTKISMIIYKLSYLEYACNSGTTLWNLGKERKEKGMDRASVISHTIRCEDG
jgi:hypothetical protein